MSEAEELQPVEDVIESSDKVTPEAETRDEGAELAPAEPEKVVFSDEQQEVFNSAIGKKTHQLRSTERELEEARLKLKEVESKLPVAAAPDIPDIPDKYDFDSDEEYYKAIRERDEKIRLNVEFEGKQKLINEQNAKIEQNALIETQKKQAEADKVLLERAEKNGIKEQDLVAAANIIGSYRLDAGITDTFLNDKDGDVMIMHLAENPLELDQLSRMSVFESARYLDTVVREKAQKFKPKSSSAPDPSTILRGGGGGEDSDGFTIE